MVIQSLNLTTPFVSFVGFSNSGKTTLVENVVYKLKSLGYKVATVKHASHGFTLDNMGTDSHRLKESGSDLVVLSSPTQLAQIEEMDAEASLSQIISMIGNRVDIILVEGYKTSIAPKIAVVSNEGDKDLFNQHGNILTTVIAHPSSKGKPQFADEDVAIIIGVLVNLIKKALVINYQHNSKVVKLELESSDFQREALEEPLTESVTVSG